MAIKNPAFGAYEKEDDFGVRESIGTRVNVERQVIDLLSAKSEYLYPQTNGAFILKNDSYMNCKVVTITEDRKKIVWHCPPGPCVTRDEFFYNWLCDGSTPTCGRYFPGDKGKGIAPTGCRHYRKCSRQWNKLF